MSLVLQSLKDEIVEKLGYELSYNEVTRSGVSFTLATKELRPQTAGYVLNPYFSIEYYKDKKGELKATATFNSWGDVGVIKIHRGNTLQHWDWAKVNDKLNEIMDKIGISCTIQTKVLKVRDGVDGDWRKRWGTTYPYLDGRELIEPKVN